MPPHDDRPAARWERRGALLTPLVLAALVTAGAAVAAGPVWTHAGVALGVAGALLLLRQACFLRARRHALREACQRR